MDTHNQVRSQVAMPQIKNVDFDMHQMEHFLNKADNWLKMNSQENREKIQRIQ